MSFFGGKNSFDSEVLFFIDNPYVLTLNEISFVDNELDSLYKKLLFDCLSKSDGLPGMKKKKVNDTDQGVDLSPYYDSVVVGDAGAKGLISFIAEGMRKKEKVSLVYDAGVVRAPDTKEQEAVDKGTLGIICDFSGYLKTDILKFYFSLFYTAVSALNSQMNVSKALQIKISKLRDLIGLKDKNAAVSQARGISTALKKGSSVLIDELDTIETMKLDTKPASETIDFLISRIAGVIGMPISYLTGMVSTGLTASGQGDEQVIERGLQNIFNEVFKRISDKLLGTNLTFKKNNWGLIAERLKLLPYIESSTLYTEDEKKKFAQDAIKP